MHISRYMHWPQERREKQTGERLSARSERWISFNTFLKKPGGPLTGLIAANAIF
jgi:hypothetical protein